VTSWTGIRDDRTLHTDRSWITFDRQMPL